MKTKVNILFWLLNMLAVFVVAQQPDSLLKEEIKPVISEDSTGIVPPNFNQNSPINTPSIATDTFKLDVTSIDISEDGVDEQIEYNSKDSMFFDIQNKKILLWGEAIVKYQTMTIEAAHIVIDWENNTMYAEGREEGKNVIGKPKFVEKETSFDSDRMTYNFKTQKGIIHQAITKQEGMNVVGQKTKFIGGDDKDTTQTDVIYSKNAIFTTCDHDHPHFGIRSRKQKVVPDKVVVIGPSNVEIAGIPTPLVLPFGFFPLKQGRRTGLIFPQNYQYNITDGYGLDGVGWFFPINDYMNLTVTGSIYFRGTFGVNAATQYRRNYKYNGRLNLGYFRRRSEIEGRSVFNPSYSLVWSHNQDSKAHPYQSFGGSVNVQTSNFRSQTENDAQSVLQSTLSSNLAYSYNFPGPFKLSTSFRHSQNTQTRRMTINFPDVNFQTETLYPFKNENRGGNQEKWYEKISFRYVGEARNTFTTTDTTLFSQQTIDDARYGVRHSVTPSMSFTVAKYFNVTPSVNYKEIWYFQSVNKTFDANDLVIDTTIFINPEDSTDIQITFDTLQYGSVNTDIVNGFQPFRQFNAGVSVNTQLFGTMLFKKGFLRGLRHVAKPNISFNFSPDYTNPDWGYFKSVRTDLREDEETEYGIFEQGIYDKPSRSGRQMALSYGIQNIFEAKIFSKRDSTSKNIKLLRNLSVRGDYNFAADSLQFSQVRVSGQTSFFNNITNLTFNLTYDPYDADSTRTRRINTFYHDNTGKYLRFVQSDFRLSTRLTIKKIRDFFKGKDTEADPTTVSNPNNRSRLNGDNDNGFGATLKDGGPPKGNRSPTAKPSESLLDLFENFSINHNFTVTRSFINGVDTTRVSTHSIDMRGQLAISENWNINVGNIGYDFLSKQVTYPSLGFSRDLHCWEMGVQWAPQRDAYAFYIRVKPGKLDFLSIPYNKGSAGSGFGGAASRFGGF